ncbi:MAG: glutamate--tRNA ligase [bacterium]|nr:glutamate--tRNA ligase [Planctomycetota bacterium]HIL51577.1 glutamate--tRNA ligase [Planctomycetota bacterium]
MKSPEHIPSEPIRVRIAPSPTGTIHLGLARTTLYNWAFAKRHGGKLILRVEDTDRARSTAESEHAILEGLHWLGTDWDEGPVVGGPHAPYHQSERVQEHLAVARRLLESGDAYRCFCTKERLDDLRQEQEAKKETPRYDRLCSQLASDQSAARAVDEPFTLRFRVPEGQTAVDDLVRGRVEFQNAEIDDWVMVRQGGQPTYNFVVVCDDAAMEISHVFRGEEHLVNTPKQILVYRALGLEPPAFGHLPLMLGQDGRKLSKRHGAVSLSKYIAEGYSRDALVNFLCRQGWALDGETEIFSVEQFIASFDPGDVSRAGAVFDFDKLRWMSGEYIHAESPDELALHCAPHMTAAGLMTAEELVQRGDWYREALCLGQERVRLYSEMPGVLGFLFAADASLEYDAKAEKNARKHSERVAELSAYHEHLHPMIELGVDAEVLRDDAKAWVAERNLKFPQLFQPLRCALTGAAGGPDLFSVMALLGPEASLARLAAGIERLA